jgi:hypothetical protein
LGWVLGFVDFRVDKNVVRNSGLVSVACIADSNAARISGEISAMFRAMIECWGKVWSLGTAGMNKCRKRGNQIRRRPYVSIAIEVLLSTQNSFFSITTPIAMFYASFPVIPVEKGFFA